MRRLIYSVAVFAGVCILAAWVFGLPPFGHAPVFYTGVEPAGRRYVCNGSPGADFFVRFQDKGRTAIVRVAGGEHSLGYRGVTGMGEAYADGSWQLTLDPEANLSGPGGIAYTNCG